MKNFYFVLMFLLSTLFIASPILAQPYPAVAVPADTTQYGKLLSRSLSLMGTSTLQNKKKVKVLVYGQSISEQKWWEQVRTYLQTTYPNADIEMQNRAVGGFASDMLWRICEMDVTSFYPDLVIFHVYGNHYFYESLIRFIRSRTAAEVLVQADHIAAGEDNLSFTDLSNWSNKMCFQTIPGYATKYGFEFMDSRRQWREYLQANSLTSVQLRKDDVHLNDHGCFVQAELTNLHLVYKPKFTPDPNGLVTEYQVGPDVQIVEGKITLPFNGNKIELVPSQAKATKLYIKVDDKKPSEFVTCYNITRPMKNGSFWNGGFMPRIPQAMPQVEEWTLKFTSQYGFEVRGSKTGIDGTGNVDQKFVSNSGRVVIHPKDWWTPKSWGNWLFTVGQEIKWNSYAMFADSLDFTSVSISSDKENALNAVQGLPNGQHTLEITSSTGEFPIKTIRVYKPSQTLHVTTSASTLNFGSGSATQSVTVTTNSFWQVRDTLSWASCDVVDNNAEQQLLESQSVKFTVQANTTGIAREGVIELWGQGCETKTITLKQSAYTLLNSAELTNKTYGDAPITLTNNASGHTVVYSSSNDQVATVNGNTITLLNAGSTEISAVMDNNIDSKVQQTLTVAQKTLIVRPVDATRKVGEANPIFELTYDGFVMSENASVLDTKPTATCTANEQSTAKTYTIKVAGGLDNNYAFTYQTGILTVTPQTGLTLATQDHSTLAPNPATDKVQITGTKLFNQVFIMNAIGAVVKQVSLNSNEFDVSDLPAGIYLVKLITNEGERVVIRLVKK